MDYYITIKKFAVKKKYYKPNFIKHPGIAADIDSIRNNYKKYKSLERLFFLLQAGIPPHLLNSNYPGIVAPQELRNK